MRIVPAPDRRVRDPETNRVVDADGLTIDPTNLHWSRLLAWGDVVEAPAPEASTVPHDEPIEEPAA